MIFNWRFWVAAVLTVTVFSGVGYAIAWFVVSPPAEYFRANYFEFAIPQGWHCDRAGTETLCEPPGKPPHDAIIILVAKLRNGKDNRNEYLNYLKNEKIWTDPSSDESITSEVLHFRKLTIGDYEWVDALHRNSELKGYNTRYLATVTSHLGIAISFSAYREHFEVRNIEFEKAIKTLRIYQSPSPFN